MSRKRIVDEQETGGTISWHPFFFVSPGVPATWARAANMCSLRVSDGKMI